MTKTVAAVPERPASSWTSRWLSFIDETTRGDKALAGYLQRLAGYLLTGDVSEHVLVFIHGPGGTGKTVFAEAIKRAMGGYAASAPLDMFMQGRHAQHTTEIARLDGIRAAFGSEVPKKSTWDLAKVKALTGGDTLAARFMRQDFFEFVPQFKVVLVGNHKPELPSVDSSVTRRLRLVPFVHVPENPDKNLIDKINPAEVLYWALNGFTQWKTRGLAAPDTVREASKLYVAEEDTFGQWLEERCERRIGLKASFAELWNDYLRWNEEQKETEHLKKNEFSRELQNRGHQKIRLTRGGGADMPDCA